MALWRELTHTFLGLLAFSIVSGSALPAQSLNWKGHTWAVTNGGMAGVVSGSANNVVLDGNGYLHLKITNSGGTWTAAELFTTDNLGFGTYQWQFEGPVDNFDKCVVLGLFPYGPAGHIGGDGENEIDIEFSKWNGEVGSSNADFAYYPATGFGANGKSATDIFQFSLGGATLSTGRTVWSSQSITGTIMSGLQPVGTTANVLHTFTFAPASGAAQKIPQVAVPLGMNFWCYGTTPASNQEIIVRDFQFIPEGSQPVTYTLSASAGAGGSISPSGNVTVSQGGSQTFTFAANSGYSISAVTVDGQSKGILPSYVFSNVTAAHTISVSFAANIGPAGYTWCAGENGSFTLPGTCDVAYGANGSFNYLYGKSGTITFNNATFGDPISGVVKSGFYKATAGQYTLTASAGSGGAISPSGGIKVNQGASQTFIITPSAGYQVSAVTVDGANVGAVGSYTFSNVTTTHTISASFAAIAGPAGYTWCAGENGSFTLPGTCDLAYGANGSFNYLYGKTGTITFNNSTFGDPISGTVKAGYYKASSTTTQYTLTASAGANGSISPSGSIKVNQGASQTFTITPASGYAVSLVTVDGTSVGAVTSYTFSNVSAAHNISATFAASSVPAWAPNIHYAVGAVVSYGGGIWINTYDHTSNSAWYPGAPGLWFWKQQ